MNIFRTKSGEIVIGQKPNLPIIISVICYVLSFFIQEQREKLLTFSLSFLILWAYLEITEGVNSFRKIIGGATMLFACLGLLII